MDLMQSLIASKLLGGGGGSEPVLKTKNIYENGSYAASADDADGYSNVTVNVPANVINRTLQVNGTFSSAVDNKDGYSNVVVDVQETPVKTTSLSVTENGTYEPGPTSEVSLTIPTIPDEVETDVSAGAIITNFDNLRIEFTNKTTSAIGHVDVYPSAIATQQIPMLFKNRTLIMGPDGDHYITIVNGYDSIVVLQKGYTITAMKLTSYSGYFDEVTVNVAGGGGEGKTKVITDDIVLVSQNGSTINWYEDGSVDLTWGGGSSIGFNYIGTVPIKSAKRVLIHMDELGESYQHSHSTEQRNWNFTVGLTNEALPQSYIDLANIDSQGKLVTDVEVDVIDNYGKTDLNYIIDLSSYQNQDLYLFILAPGMTITGLKVTLVYDNNYNEGQYKFHWSNDSKICVREEVGAVKWFFMGVTKGDADIDVPAELVPYLPDFEAPGQYMSSAAYTDQEEEWDGSHYIGFVYPGTANVKIRSWNSSSLGGGTFWGVLNITHYPFNNQQNEYVDPTDVSAQAMKVGSKTIIANGIYSAEDDGYTGYSEVTVNVFEPQVDYTNICGLYTNGLQTSLGKHSMVSNYFNGSTVGCSWNGTIDLVEAGYSKMHYKAYIGPNSYDTQYNQNIRPVIIGVSPNTYNTMQYVNQSTASSVYTAYDIYPSSDYKDVTVEGVIDFSNETDPQYLLIVATGHDFEMLDMWFE